jgi:hypothetical protein
MTIIVRIQKLFLSETRQVAINEDISILNHSLITNLSIFLSVSLRNLMNLKSSWILKEHKS